jgi:cell division protein ZapE
MREAATGDSGNRTVVFRRTAPKFSGDQLGIRSAYSEVRDRERLQHDPAQLGVVEILQQLQDELDSERSALQQLKRWWQKLRRRKTAGIRGIYLWGDVGRGKTFLMDLFYASLKTSRKKRTHFHRMMSEVHARLNAMGHIEDPVDQVAAQIARSTSILCFDEFFVSDIGDAMILGRLLGGLVERGVTLIATSNTAPADLYADGLQRERFLPAIALLQMHTRVIHMSEGADYRLRLLQRAGTYLTPADAAAESALQRFFHDSAASAGPEELELVILGRTIATRHCAGNVVWFEFTDICQGPRSTEDYIEIARRFQTVVVSGLPVLSAELDDAARRFVSLVDEFYDRRVKLIVSAAATIDTLYQGKRLAFEFRRTASRLSEMQSTDYLHQAHRG